MRSPVSTGCSAACRSREDRKSTRLNSSHTVISYAVFCLKKEKIRVNSSHTVSSQGDVCLIYNTDVCVRQAGGPSCDTDYHELYHSKSIVCLAYRSIHLDH